VPGYRHAAVDDLIDFVEVAAPSTAVLRRTRLDLSTTSPALPHWWAARAVTKAGLPGRVIRVNGILTGEVHTRIIADLGPPIDGTSLGRFADPRGIACLADISLQMNPVSNTGAD
jgi:hypothetical protein